MVKEWQDVSGGRIYPAIAYRVSLPSGRTMNLFFYDGPIAQALAFEGLLDNGEAFANRLLSAFADDSPRLVHIATDGESYGHHHHNGDMALAHALHHIESNGLAQVTNYGRYLEDHPPAFEVEIFENSSVELRARHRTLAVRLRVQQRRPPGLEPGLASPPACGPGLAPRCREPGL